MRGRWASAIGAGIARHRAGDAMDQQSQMYEQQQQQQQQAQRQIGALKQQNQPAQQQHEDPMELYQ